MKRIHIFKAGRHTSSQGTTLDFSEEALQAAVEAYDPKLHEAPIVVGHPKDNGPAFGWISGLEFEEGNVDALPTQVNADFAEMVKTGAFKKVSASWYTPDSPANPKPGAYYLRHVGFLGAQPPAIKGLEGVQFSEEEEGVVEFAAEWETAGIFRRLREFFIEKFGVEEADKAIPSYMVEGAEDAARTPKETADAAYSETGESTMTEEELKAAQDQLAADRAALETRESDLKAREESFAEAERTARRDAMHKRVDDLVDAGKIVPAQAPGLKSFAEQLSAEATVEFGEGDGAEKKPAVDYFFEFLESQAKGPDFEERAPGTGEAASGDMTAEELAVKAMEYREERAKAGTKISYTEAVAAVVKQ